MEELGGHLSRVSLDELKKDNGDVSLASVGLFFPRGIFFEILSWLPVKYLVRCKAQGFGSGNPICLTESRKLTQIAGAGAGAAGKRSYIACPSSVVTFKRNAIGEDTSIQTRIGHVNQAR
ncbi:hypothetical protein Q3G72_013901 [Acer saccharum]|nr:hypothetical protein Q3G72_013901 [Acer saccharum]